MHDLASGIIYCADAAVNDVAGVASIGLRCCRREVSTFARHWRLDLRGARIRRMPYDRRMAELLFEVVQVADGGYCAECLTENIFTEGDTWELLRKNALEATTAFFFDRPRPERIRLHLVRDEILSVA